jgi:thymidine kinase
MKARHDYACWRCEHPIRKGSEYVREIHDSFEAGMKHLIFYAHVSNKVGCLCAQCGNDPTGVWRPQLEIQSSLE